MAATISESYESRPFTLGDNAGRELVYTIFGTEDETVVQSLLLSASFTVYLGLLRESIEAEPLGNGVWKGYVRYTTFEDDNEYTFEIGGGTRKITQSLGTVARYAPPGLVAPDFQGAIGVSEDKVEGCEVPDNKSEFSETHRLADAAMTNDYKRTLRSLVGCWNEAPFRHCDPGECLLLGVSGSKRGDELWSLTFKFAESPNATGLEIGADIAGYYGYGAGGVITGIDKLGWDFLWVRYADYYDIAGNALVKRPVAAYVERVLLPGDFSQLGIGV